MLRQKRTERTQERGRISESGVEIEMAQYLWTDTIRQKTYGCMEASERE